MRMKWLQGNGEDSASRLMSRGALPSRKKRCGLNDHCESKITFRVPVIVILEVLDCAIHAPTQLVVISSSTCIPSQLLEAANAARPSCAIHQSHFSSVPVRSTPQKQSI